MTHCLKTTPEYFEAVQSGAKTFELRREDDKTFDVGDTLMLLEWDFMSLPDAVKTWWNALSADAHKSWESLGYTGRECTVEVTYVLRDAQWLQPGVAALGILPGRPGEKKAGK